MVDVNTQSKTISVNVSSSGVSSNVNASGDTALYYSNKAKEWATSNRIVDGVDYSSKYYAGKANQSAIEAEGAKELVLQAKDSVVAEVIQEGNIQKESLKEASEKEQETITEIKNSIEQGKAVYIGESEPVDDIFDIWLDPKDNDVSLSIKEIQEQLSKSGGGLEIGDIGFTQTAIDESKGKRRILNGQLIIQEQYVQFTNIIKESVALNPDLACTEEEWQTEVTMNASGLCGKFVIDDEGGTIRLPKYPDHFVAGLADIAPVAGNGMTLGLTDGNTNKGLYETSSNVLTGATNLFGTNIGTSGGSDSFKDNVGIGITTDPSKSGMVAQLDEAGDRIYGTYFIQVATGSETKANITNTLENVKGFTLLESKYSDKPLYNESWLLSNGQWNGKSVYPTAYEGLQVEYNTEIEAGTTVTLPSGLSYTKRGLSVKLSTETYTDYDFVLNTSEETFRLPIKVKLAGGKAVVGNGMTLGLTDGSSNAGIFSGVDWNGADAGGNAIKPSEPDYAKNVGVTKTAPSYSRWGDGKLLGITPDPTKSGIETSDSGLYLYFYVGDLDQNHGIVNMGRIGEQLASLTAQPHITETYVNGTSWYNIYSNGWCEQGGIDTNSSDHYVSLLKPFLNANYVVSLQQQSTNTGSIGRFWVIGGKAFDKFFAISYQGASTGQTSQGFSWRACGYIS